MYSLTSEHQNNAMQETSPAKPIARGDLVTVLRMFINTFGLQPLLEHRDFSQYSFDYLHDLAAWEIASALQIAVDTTAACPVADERVERLKQQFRNLLGDLSRQTLVRIQGEPFVIEPPPVPM